MNKNYLQVIVCLIHILTVNPVMADNVPIQRLDISNLLGSSIITQTPVAIDFNNDGSAPCFSTIIPVQGTLTVWAGIGQPCIAPISSITITPLATKSGVGVAYNSPGDINFINNAFYLNQIIIKENTSPSFDPLNGAIISQGTMLTNITSYFKNNANP